MTNIILPYAKNFKKSARYLPDKLLNDQIYTIDMFRELLFSTTDSEKIKQFPSAYYYKAQAKWLYKYQIELIKEWQYRYRQPHSKYGLYVAMYRRLKNLWSPLHPLYGKAKWNPGYFTDSNLTIFGRAVETYSRKDVKHCANKTYTRRKAPRRN